MYDEEAILECARTIRAYLPRLLSDQEQVHALDAQLADYIRRRKAGEFTSVLITEALRQNPATRQWMQKFLNAENEGTIESRLRQFTPIAGDPDFIPAQRYACPVDCDTVWYRQFEGEPIPICRTHKKRLKPAQEAPC
ncbi:MAG TPA: hypothetical protein EYH32_05325 [Anaerolineae bacterium]|nr:hypothetical protein [Anaerolineae bacterium]